jgi:hypothetical protein
MPAIEKIQETWTLSSITTLFRLCSKADIDKSLPLQSPIVGFSWSLMLAQVPRRRRDYGPSMCQLSFCSSACHSTWCGEQVEVTLSFPSHPSALPAGSTAVVLGRGYPFTLTTCSPDDLKDALVSMEVTFTSLPTCNIFHAFAHVGPVPCAPTSAEEPSAHQARSARNALEQSFKTGTSFDIIFQAYTRRLSPGKAAKPSPIYASTTVLRGTAPLPDFCTFYPHFP